MPDAITGNSAGWTICAAVGLSVATGWKTTEASWDFIPACRGEYPLRSPVVTSGFPFGLWLARRELSVAGTLLVWPRTFPVGPVPESVRGHSSDGLALRDKPGTWGDLLGVRPYRRGDSLRRIHWPQTARHGQLVVCEVQSSAVSRVQIVLDTHPSSHTGSAPDGSREWAIRVAASFVEGWIRQGVEVELALDGIRHSISPAIPLERGRRVCLTPLRDSRPAPRGPPQTVCYTFLSADCATPGCESSSRPTSGLLRRASQTSANDAIASWYSRPQHSAGGESGAATAPVPVVPWIVIDGPEYVAHALMPGWKGSCPWLLIAAKTHVSTGRPSSWRYSPPRRWNNRWSSLASSD